MAFQARCNLCDKAEDAPGTITPGGGLFGRPARPELPSPEWEYVEVPSPLGGRRLCTVCPGCMPRLWSLFGIQESPGTDDTYEEK